MKIFFRKRILITGAGGYIGGHLTDAFSKIDCHIVRLGRKKLPVKTNTNATIEDICTDLTEYNHWDALIASVDYIFHLAAQTGIKTADDFPVKDTEINVISFLKILEAAKNAGNKTVILAGSATQYGLQNKLPVNESATDAAITLYDINKCIAEKYLHYFCQKNWVRGTCLRLSNVYGPGVKSGNISRGILNQVIENALAGNTISIYGQGESVRDYIYITDIINAFLQAALHDNALSQSYYLIGSGIGTTLKEAFALAIQCVYEKSGNRVTLMNREFPKDISPIDYRHFIADSTAFSTLTGWHPTHSLRTGIEKTIDFYKTGVVA